MPWAWSLIRDELLSSIPAVNKMLVRWSWPARLRNFIAQAGMQVRPGKLVLISAVSRAGGLGSDGYFIPATCCWRLRRAFLLLSFR